jgi:hypothetical protein
MYRTLRQGVTQQGRRTKYVPYGHAHQSGVECDFSQVRSCKRNAAATFPKCLLAQTVKKGLDTTSMKKGKIYDDELLQATETNNDPKR